MIKASHLSKKYDKICIKDTLRTAERIGGNYGTCQNRN